MQYRKFGRTGFEISAVTYGGIVSTKEEQQDSNAYVEWALEKGVNYFDVAPTYGDAQLKLGNSLIPYRDKIHLACKTKKRTAKEAEEEFKESMQLLHTDHFDVYQMHEMTTMEDVETAFGPDGIMQLLPRLKEEGYISNIGITAHTEEVALEAIRRYDFDTVLFPFNWLMNMSRGMGNRLIPVAKEREMGLLCMKSLIHRKWFEGERDTSRYPKSWCKPIDPEEPEFRLAALKYALSLGVDTLIPPGNFECFSFVVEHIDGILANPYGPADAALLEEKLAECRGLEFF